MPQGWRREDDGRVVGDFPGHRVDFLRSEMQSLRRMAQRRVREMPRLMPFGLSVAFAVSAELPGDDRLRALLDHFVGADEPDEVKRWNELDFWIWLDVRAGIALDDTIGVVVEIRDQNQAAAFATAASAIAVLADLRYLGTEHDWVARWLRGISERLTAIL